MPEYQYKCDSCNYSFDIYQKINSPTKKTCPKCKAKSLYKIFGSVLVFCNNVNTIGQLAEKNKRTKGKGKDQKTMKEKISESGIEKVKKDAKIPWWRSGDVKGLPKMDKPLNLKKINNVKNYIEGGK